MPTPTELRAQAREADRRIAAVTFISVQGLAARWNVDAETVKAIPREQLPYVPLGTKRVHRRYDPADVEEYERRAKRGEFDPPKAREESAA